LIVTTKPVRKRPFEKAPAPASSGMLLGYARVSKGDEQNNALQAKALRAAGCRKPGATHEIGSLIAGYPRSSWSM